MFVGLSAASVWLIGAPPPRRIVLATGDPDGGFAILGREYKSLLEPMGLKVELLESTGSIANLEAVRTGRADAAFAQSGVTRKLESTENLCSLAAIDAQLKGVTDRILKMIGEMSKSATPDTSFPPTTPIG